MIPKIYKTHSVRLAVTNYYEVEVQAPDDHHIFNHEDPKFARHISKKDLNKLRNPEWYQHPVERINKIESIRKPVDFSTEQLEKEIFNHA